MEYVKGFEFVRQPDFLITDEREVETHSHHKSHITDFLQGVWDAYRFVPILNADGVQLKTKVEKTFDFEIDGVKKSETEMVEELMWQGLPVLRIQGGGPACSLEIPAEMKHRFVPVHGTGPHYYRCRFAHRDGDGELCEVWQGYDRWTE